MSTDSLPPNDSARRPETGDEAAAFVLTAVRELQTIKGNAFPASITFRQLIVTGPPGVGKTTQISALGGWPDEGFLDLTQRNWWRSRILALRPRQVHLGMPFAGHPKALAVFDPEWLAAPTPPLLDLSRVQLPPAAPKWTPWKGKEKYVFEFLVPPAESVFAARQQRSDQGSHPVDVEVSLEQVREQLRAYWTVALHFHRAGMPVYLRDDFGGLPKVFVEEIPNGAWQTGVTARSPARKRTPFLHTYIKRIITSGSPPVMEDFERLHLRGAKAKIPLRALPIEVTLGDQTLQVHPERPLRPLGGDAPRSVVLFDPDEYFSRISPFIRLRPHDRIRIGKGEEDRLITPKLPADILPRLEIVMETDALTLIDLESPAGAKITQLDPDQCERLPRARRERLRRVCALFGGPLRALDPDEALSLLESVIGNLRTHPYRPRDWRGEPGGLVELPPDLKPVIVGDLHANLDNLLRILSENRYLEDLEAGQACMIVLGDAVHNEDRRRLTEMDSSVLMMDVILKLMLAFPKGFVYIRGNHDSFSHEVTKDGVAQAHLWKQRLLQLRGERFVEAMQSFYDLLPYLAMSDGFIACHAGPPLETVTKEQLIDINRHPRLMHQLMWNRLQSPKTPSGYTKRDVRGFQKAVGLKKKASALIVSHNTRPGEQPAQLDFGGIKRHHLVYSARRDQMAVFIRTDNIMTPLTYPAEPLLDLTNDLAPS